MNQAIATIAIIALLLLAGCGADVPRDSTPTATPNGPSERDCREVENDILQTHTFYEGESFGAQTGDEHWKITVADVGENHANLTFTKTIPDEVGQNKEGIDPMYDYKRLYVEPGQLELIEPHMKVGVFSVDDGSATIIQGRWQFDQSDMPTLIECRKG